MVGGHREDDFVPDRRLNVIRMVRGDCVIEERDHEERNQKAVRERHRGHLLRHTAAAVTISVQERAPPWAMARSP